MSDYQRPKHLNLLAVVAHPHDFTHMAGTCAHHIEDGDTVTAVSITGGNKVHNERLYDELKKPPGERDMSIVTQSTEAYADEKAEQFHRMCELFGITDARILPFADVPLRGSDEMYETLTEIVLETRPHIVLTCGPIGNS